jgi:hypothetical protein
MFLKPRRWYSSPEVNPLPNPPPVSPPISAVALRYGSKVRKDQGPVLKYQNRAHFYGARA